MSKTVTPPTTPPDPPPTYTIPPECIPNVEDIVIQDDTPMDSIYHEKQQRLLVEPLQSSWPGPGDGRPFMALANVGLFYQFKVPPLVPDAMLSVDVKIGDPMASKEDNSYFVWVVGKVPDVVVEVVSNREGGEDSTKLLKYAKFGVPHYVIYDPLHRLGEDEFRGFELVVGKYQPRDVFWMPDVGLGSRQRQGRYEDMDCKWLRWCDAAGNVIPSGAERAVIEAVRAEEERRHADQQRQRAEQEKQRAEQEKQRADSAEDLVKRLQEQLRALGQVPTAMS